MLIIRAFPALDKIAGMLYNNPIHIIRKNMSGSFPVLLQNRGGKMHSRKFIKTAACMFLAFVNSFGKVPVRTFADEQGSSAEVLYDEGGSATTASSENTGSSTELG